MKIRDEKLEYDITPGDLTVDTVTVRTPNRGDPTDVRTFKPGKTKTFPMVQSTDQSKVPGLVQPFRGEVGLPGARTGGRLPRSSDTQTMEYERTVTSDSLAKHAAKAAEVAESVRSVIAEDRKRKY